jgi:hypothetical protein
MQRILLSAALLSLVLTPSTYASIGLDFGGSPGSYTTFGARDNWTLGYEFSVPAGTTVNGLGFWDLGNGFNTTTVGLWTATGTLLGTVSSATSAVTTTPTANGFGTWNFMNFNLAVPAGNYVVGSWGDEMEYAFSGSPSQITNGLTFVQTRYQGGGIFQYPATTDFTPNGYYGGNISLGAPINAIPEPLSLLIWGGLATVGGCFAHRRGRQN